MSHSLLLEPAPSSMDSLKPASHKDPPPCSAQLEQLLLSAKSDMFDVIQDGDNLKLEMRALKEQFLSLLKNFDMYQQHQRENESRMSQTGKNLLCGGLSAPRTRARTITEARRNRLATRLSSRNVDVNSNSVERPASVEDVPAASSLAKPYTPRYSKSSSSRTCGCKTKKHCCSKAKVPMTPIEEEDKENMGPVIRRKAKESGDYVTLKKPDCGEYVTLRKSYPSANSKKNRVPEETSLWDSVTSNTVTLSSENYSISPQKPVERILAGLSPLKQYAPSAVINQVYNAKSIKDISIITDISQVSVREQNSGIDFQGPLHSTVNYPLHSTMNQTQMNHFGLNRSLEELSDIEQGDSDTKSVASSAKSAKLSKMRQLKVPKHIRQAMHVLPHECITTSEHSPPNLRHDDTFTVEDVSEDEGIAVRRPHIRYANNDTDCDSSYLSEYDDIQSHHGRDSASEYVATYDSRRGSMKMMKRQKARIDLEHTRAAIGITDDVYALEDNHKHLSMVVNRSSFPDLSALSSPSGPSTPTPESQDTDSTYRSSQKRRPESLDGTLVEASRPPSIGMEQTHPKPTKAGQVREDPSSSDSAKGRVAPLNSPNATTTGSSSSRPSTDTYDYFDLKKLPKREPPQGMADSPSKSSLVSQPSSHSSRIRKPRKQARYSLGIGYDSALSSSNYSSKSSVQGCHFQISDSCGNKQTFVQHSAVASHNLKQDHKRKLARKIKRFNKDLQRDPSHSVDSLNLKTLGHF